MQNAKLFFITQLDSGVLLGNVLMLLHMDAYSNIATHLLAYFFYFLNITSQQSLFIRAGVMKYSSTNTQVMNDYTLLQPGQISASYFAIASLSSDVQQLAV